MPHATFPENVQALLAAMVSTPSVNTTITQDPMAEAMMIELNDETARAMGFATQRIPVRDRADNLLVMHEVDPSRPWLMFESHVDTVTVSGMTIDPFDAVIDDGKLWGRGSCDTKGTGAAMLWALHEYQAGPDKPNNVAICYTIDEEYGMLGVRQLVAEYDRLPFRPVGVIVGEPTMLQPVVTHQGVVRWRVTTTGTACHSSDPSKGHSAISDMTHVIQAIESQYVPQLTACDPLAGKAQCSINLIQGGRQINTIPDECRIDVDRRVAPGEDQATVLPAVGKILEKLANEHADLCVQQQLLFACPPLTQNHNGSLLTLVQHALKNQNLPTQPIGVPYATDAGDLDAAGIPAIVLGPGDIAKAHTHDEYIALDQLNKAVEVYRQLMRTPI